MSSRQTLFSDVCGTMDELKRLVKEESEQVVADPQGTAVPLLHDALSMLDRMDARLDQYSQLWNNLQGMLEQAGQIQTVDAKKASRALQHIEDDLMAQGPDPQLDIEAINTLAEETRTVASAQEHLMRAHKDLALKLHESFVWIKGNRGWIVSPDSGESAEDTIKQKHQAWLPPQPHCTHLLARLVASTAHIVEAQRQDEEPVIQFMDGGMIRMSQVRWDPQIKNFHPASFQPPPTGRQYRRTSPENNA